MPEGDPGYLPQGLELCLCSLAACGLAALLFTASVVQVTGKFSSGARFPEEALQPFYGDHLMLKTL